MHSRRNDSRVPRSSTPRSSRARWLSDYTAFRQRLTSAREQAGMTQAEAARGLGRSQSFVAKSETGERRVDIVELVHFAALYKKPVAYFVPSTPE